MRSRLANQVTHWESVIKSTSSLIYIRDEDSHRYFWFYLTGHTLHEKKYIDSHNCRLEIQFANVLRKPMIICMLERIPIAEIKHGIALIIA